MADQPKLRPLLEALERLCSRGLMVAVVMVAFHRRRGMGDVRASPPLVPEDAEWWVVNRAHAKVYKEQKDAKEARRKRKSLEHGELEKRRRQQRHDGLPVEPSPSPSSTDSSSDDDESEVGWGPLAHLPDVGGTVPRVSASSPASLGGGGEDASGLAIARPRAEADAPEAWALGKRAISLVGSTVEVEQMMVGATQWPLQRVEGALESSEGRPVTADTEAVPPPFRKHQAEALALVPCKALKATEVATKQAEEEEPTLGEAEAHESDEAEVPSITKDTKAKAEALRTSEAKVAEAEALRASEAKVVDVGAPRTAEAEVAEASLGVVEPAAQDVEMEAGQASVPPSVQDPPPSQESAREVEVHSISSDDTSWGKEVVDAEATSTVEWPAPTLGEGSSALVQSTEVEDLRLRCVDMKAEAAIAREQAAPLAARIKELEEELTQVAGKRDTFRSRAEQVEVSAKAVAGQLGVEQGAHLLTKGALAEALKVVKVSWVKALAWKEKAKRTLAIVSSHYVGIDLEAISDGYVLAKDDKEAKEEVMKLVEVAEAPGMALAKLFEEEVVPPTPSADAGDPKF
ncbi:uncharacterized protein [Miscanthus floridulus]|uniref:uncharacterized protein n=1 Tax=Miscanthus floridulus TaxID=154761 RepID=UPI003457633B